MHTRILAGIISELNIVSRQDWHNSGRIICVTIVRKSRQNQFGNHDLADHVDLQGSVWTMADILNSAIAPTQSVKIVKRKESNVSV